MVPESAYSTLISKQQYAPGQVILSQLSSLDQQMQEILGDTSTPADQKLQKYNNVLRRFLDVRTEQKRPQRIELINGPTTKTPTSAAISQADEEPQAIHNIVHTLPVSAQTTGRVLMAHLMGNTNTITWTADGRLIYQGVPIPNSNITDLFIDSVTRNRHVAGPVGYRQFATLLKETNVPSRAIGNSLRKQAAFSPVLGTPSPGHRMMALRNSPVDTQQPTTSAHPAIARPVRGRRTRATSQRSRTRSRDSDSEQSSDSGGSRQIGKGFFNIKLWK